MQMEGEEGVMQSCHRRCKSVPSMNSGSIELNDTGLHTVRSRSGTDTGQRLVPSNRSKIRLSSGGLLRSQSKKRRAKNSNEKSRSVDYDIEERDKSTRKNSTESNPSVEERGEEFVPIRRKFGVSLANNLVPKCQNIKMQREEDFHNNDEREQTPLQDIGARTDVGDEHQSRDPGVSKHISDLDKTLDVDKTFNDNQDIKEQVHECSKGQETILKSRRRSLPAKLSKYHEDLNLDYRKGHERNGVHGSSVTLAEMRKFHSLPTELNECYLSTSTQTMACIKPNENQPVDNMDQNMELDLEWHKLTYDNDDDDDAFEENDQSASSENKQCDVAKTKSMPQKVARYNENQSTELEVCHQISRCQDDKPLKSHRRNKPKQQRRTKSLPALLVLEEIPEVNEEEGNFDHSLESIARLHVNKAFCELLRKISINQAKKGKKEVRRTHSLSTIQERLYEENEQSDKLGIVAHDRVKDHATQAQETYDKQFAEGTFLHKNFENNEQCEVGGEYCVRHIESSKDINQRVKKGMKFVGYDHKEQEDFKQEDFETFGERNSERIRTHEQELEEARSSEGFCEEPHRPSQLQLDHSDNFLKDENNEKVQETRHVQKKKKKKKKRPKKKKGAQSESPANSQVQPEPLLVDEQGQPMKSLEGDQEKPKHLLQEDQEQSMHSLDEDQEQHKQFLDENQEQPKHSLDEDQELPTNHLDQEQPKNSPEDDQEQPKNSPEDDQEQPKNSSEDEQEQPKNSPEDDQEHQEQPKHSLEEGQEQAKNSFHEDQEQHKHSLDEDQEQHNHSLEEDHGEPKHSLVVDQDQPNNYLEDGQEQPKNYVGNDQEQPKLSLEEDHEEPLHFLVEDQEQTTNYLEDDQEEAKNSVGNDQDQPKHSLDEDQEQHKLSLEEDHEGPLNSLVEDQEQTTNSLEDDQEQSKHSLEEDQKQTKDQEQPKHSLEEDKDQAKFCLDDHAQHESSLRNSQEQAKPALENNQALSELLFENDSRQTEHSHRDKHEQSWYSDHQNQLAYERVQSERCKTEIDRYNQNEKLKSDEVMAHSINDDDRCLTFSEVQEESEISHNDMNLDIPDVLLSEVNVKKSLELDVDQQSTLIVHDKTQDEPENFQCDILQHVQAIDYTSLDTPKQLRPKVLPLMELIPEVDSDICDKEDSPRKELNRCTKPGIEEETTQTREKTCRLENKAIQKRVTWSEHLIEAKSPETPISPELEFSHAIDTDHVTKADIAEQDKDFDGILRDVINSCLEPDYSTSNSAVHRAVAQGCVETLVCLIEGGVDVNGIDEHGWPPLHVAMLTNNVDCAAILLDAGADLQHYTDALIQEYRTVRKDATSY